MSIRMICLAMMLVPSAALLGEPQSAVPQREAQQILAAVVRFADALQSGDRDAIVKAVSIVETSLRQRDQREMFASLIEAEKKLEREAEQRWGTEGRRLLCGFDLLFTEQDRKGLSKAQVFLDDASLARVVLDGETSAIRLRRNSAGQWQVIIDVVDVEPDSETSVSSWMDMRQRIRRDRYRGYAEAVAATLAKVQKGEFASAQAAETDLAERFAKVAAEVAQRMSTINSGVPSFR